MFHEKYFFYREIFFIFVPLTKNKKRIMATYNNIEQLQKVNALLSKRGAHDISAIDRFKKLLDDWNVSSNQQKLADVMIIVSQLQHETAILLAETTEKTLIIHDQKKEITQIRSELEMLNADMKELAVLASFKDCKKRRKKRNK